MFSDATQSYEVGLEYGGVLRYMTSHNRFRVFQQVSARETGYGMLYLNRLADIFRDGGFTPQQEAVTSGVGTVGCALFCRGVFHAGFSDLFPRRPEIADRQF